MKKVKKLTLLLNAILIPTVLPIISASCAKPEKGKLDKTNENNSGKVKEEEKTKEKNKTRVPGQPDPGDDVEVDPAGPPLRYPGDGSFGELGAGRNATVPDIDPKTFNALPNEEEKYKVEEASYIKGLESNDFFPKYSTFDTTKYDVEKFDRDAKANNLPSFKDSVLKDFSVPNRDGKLVLNPFGNSLKGPYWQSEPLDAGRSRFIPNDKYKELLNQSFRIIFSNTNEDLQNETNATWGTTWILDYAKSNPNESYPTKWYLATNLHVAMSFRQDESHKNDPYHNISNAAEEAKNYKAAKAEFDSAFEDFKVMATQLGYYAIPMTDYGVPVGGTTTPEFDYGKIYTDPRMRPYINKYENAQKLFQAAQAANKGKTSRITLERFRKDTPLKTRLNFTYNDPNVERVTLDPEQVKIVYAGTNFLKTNPSDYVANEKLKNLQEMADFAVLEIDFSKSKNFRVIRNDINFANYSQNFNINTAQDFAKWVTNGYAELPENEKAKPANFDINEIYNNLKDEKVSVSYDTQKQDPNDLNNLVDTTINVKTDKLNVNFLALGFPNAEGDNQIEDEKFLTQTDRVSLRGAASVWVNKPKNLKRTTDEEGWGVSRSLAIRNFRTKPGIFDLTIVSPTISDGASGFTVPKFFEEKDAPWPGKEFLFYGLGFSLNSWEPLGGSSGSQVRDIDRNIVGINFAAGDSAAVSLISLVLALRSNGIDYKGAYGKYNLEQYDLVYGGGRNQRTSYRQALEKLYNGDYKTHLFPEGVKNIPVDHQFKNTTSKR
ncbi:Ig-specific serine endopeptidase MIP [Mycoplasma struthionis]|uniref:DUF31 domain-containing protein n=1 Tax=Mycoplasma struthionis TaxID=538220 RepID=A0A3G8LH16_9MOLU|nr:DUF31 family protein [Mycoplasma struthionis]AZG68617.1 hypothetical protein EGN60_01375 [Mycoplasma struthionis]